MGASDSVKPYRALSRTLCLVCLAAASVMLGSAPSRAQDASPAPINPTGRTIEMIVPLNYREFYLGDLQLRLTPDQQAQVPRADLVRAVTELLRPEALKALAAAGGGGEHVSLAVLRQHGFDFKFDPGAVSIAFNPTLDQKVEGNISIQARQFSPDSPNAAEPAKLAAFLNLRSALDYIGHSPSGDEGLRAPRLDLEGAARWQGVVLEAEATFEPDDVSVFGESGEGFKRRGTRLVKDFEAEAVRATAGDVYPIGSGLQYTPDLLGISLERSYTKLQPGRNMRSTSRRSFRLERPSSVDVQVNGLTVRRLRLDPGDYNLSDLPVSAGANDMVLLIEDDVGHQQKLEFSYFLDSALLAPGLSEWAFAAGVPAGFTGGEPDYESDNFFVTGFYRRGLAESVTGEAHLQSNADSVMSGLGVLFGSGIGFFELEGAASFQAEGSWGAAFNGDFSAAKIEDGYGRSHNIRLSAKARTPDFAPPTSELRLTGHDDAVHCDWLALSASYATQLPFQISASVSGGYGFALAPYGDSYHADLSFSRPIGRQVSLALSGGYYVRDEDADLSLLVRLQYRPDRDSSVSALYDARYGRSSVAYDRQFGHGVGGWETSIDVTHEKPGDDGTHSAGDDDASLNASLHYTGNRANISIVQDSRFAGVDAYLMDQRTSLRLETAIAFADGHVALGRPVSNGFAIVAPIANLAAHDISIGGEASGVTARTDFLGPALLPSVSPYTLNRIDYDVADLPSGYDLGDGLFDLMPKHRSGYALTVGSAYTVTALGTLIGPQDEPVALLTGHAIEEANPKKQVELFTNREGRFSAQGLAPGNWIIEMATEPKTRYRLTIPADTVGLYRAQSLRPL